MLKKLVGCVKCNGQIFETVEKVLKRSQYVVTRLNTYFKRLSEGMNDLRFSDFHFLSMKE